MIKSSLGIGDSVFVSEDVSVRSPRQIVICSLKKINLGATYPNNNLSNLETKITDWKLNSNAFTACFQFLSLLSGRDGAVVYNMYILLD